MKLLKTIKNLTKFEKIYIIIFIASILAGMAYGLVDRDYFKCCENSIGVPKEGTSPMKIFTSNYFLSLTEMLTAGLSSLYFNFHTFSITSSYLNSNGEMLTLPIILFIGIFELTGGLLLALAGFGFVERKLLKIKSRLKFWQPFLLGTALIFIGAIFEYMIL